jgi:hypothetical protein
MADILDDLLTLARTEDTGERWKGDIAMRAHAEIERLRAKIIELRAEMYGEVASRDAEIERLRVLLAESDAMLACHANTIDPNPRDKWPKGSFLEKAVARYEATLNIHKHGDAVYSMEGSGRAASQEPPLACRISCAGGTSVLPAGRTKLFTDADILRLIEALPCPSSSSRRAKARTGRSGGRISGGTLTEALALASERSPPKCSKGSSDRSNVVPCRAGRADIRERSSELHEGGRGENVSQEATGAFR